jgi:phage-related protein
MSFLTYHFNMDGAKDKPLVWLHGEVKSPPFTSEARLEVGFLLRLLQQGESIGLPRSRPMPSVGPGCHELRISDASSTWRIIYKVAVDAIVILEVFSKKTQSTPYEVVEVCRRRLRKYEAT